MKKLIAIFVLLATAGGGTWYYYNYGKPKEKPQVLTAAVSRQDITEVVQATGSLEATRLVNVGSQVSGTVKDLHGVDYNSIVKKGQVIAELDDSLLKVQVDIANANIQRSENDILQQRVQLENDKLNLARMQAQFDAKLASKQQLETAQLAVKSREASINSALKGITQQQATLAQAELNVKYCTIVSPIDGVVVERMVDIGQAVQSSVNVAQFFRIATDLTNLKLTAMVDEAEIGKVRRGMSVLFKVDSYGTQDFSGTVDAVRLNAMNSNNVVTYPVWITVPNSDLKLKPSMTASIRIVVSTAESALRIPNGALRFKPNTEVYLALGLTPPAAGAGGRNAAAGPGGNTRGQGGNGANAQADNKAGQPPVAGAPPAAPDASKAPVAGQPGPTTPGQQAQNMSGRAGQGGQNGRSGQGGTGGRGFGNGVQNTQQGAADFMNRAGRTPGGRGGAGGRGGNNQSGGRGGGGRSPANATGNATPLTQRTTSDGAKAEKIDDLFPDLPKIIQSGTVYTWDEAKKELKGIQVRYGVTDGQFSELISGDVQQGQNLVTNVIIPQVVKPGAPNANPFMGGQQNRGGMGGMTPGGGPGGGGAGGGGGGRGGGGGGGGRGGGN